MEIFTFTVQAFNQENTVIEALESIKYQILQYGKKYSLKYSLIFADDCSLDRTAEYAVKWIEIHSNLFFSIKTIIHTVNKGIVKTYREIIRNVEGKYLKEMSGDDVIASCDILGRCCELGNNEIFIFPQLHIKKNSIRLADSAYYKRYFYDMKHGNQKEKMRKRFRMGILAFNSTSILYCITILNKLGCLDYLEKFDYVEDAPVLSVILDSYRCLDFKYFSQPVYLYRINSSSVTHVKETNNKVLRDISVLMEDYAKNETVLWKKYFHSKKKAYSGKRCFPLYSVIDRVYLCWIFLYAAVITRKAYVKFICGMKKSVRKENMYFTYIKKESRLFLKKIK